MHLHRSGGGVQFEIKMNFDAPLRVFVSLILPWDRFGPTRTASP
jgi:hypothetical protein